MVLVTTSDHDHLVQQSFRRQVGRFSGADSPFARREGALGWVEPLDAEMTALEVACGAAHAAETVAPHVRQVVGIDLTPELLNLGAQRLAEGGIKNVLLQQANAERLPFVDQSFDVVFCRSSLHHFGHPAGAVEEMVRVSRHGGRVVLLDLIAPSSTDRERFDYLHRLLDPSHVRAYTEDELAAIFPNKVTLAHGETTTMRFPIDVAITKQSDSDAVVAALHNELAGGEPTGFEPLEQDGTLLVSFITCVVHGTVENA